MSTDTDHKLDGPGANHSGVFQTKGPDPSEEKVNYRV